MLWTWGSGFASASGPGAQVKWETMTAARVLIVEDERLIAQAFGRLVTRLGH
jgi:hypothetical protein